jgi:hypothetical protein
LDSKGWDFVGQNWRFGIVRDKISWVKKGMFGIIKDEILMD